MPAGVVQHMGLMAKLHGITLSKDHYDQATIRAHDVDALMRCAHLHLSEAVRDLQSLISVCPADDPNYQVICEMIELLK